MLDHKSLVDPDFIILLTVYSCSRHSSTRKMITKLVQPLQMDWTEGQVAIALQRLVQSGLLEKLDDQKIPDAVEVTETGEHVLLYGANNLIQIGSNALALVLLEVSSDKGVFIENTSLN